MGKSDDQAAQYSEATGEFRVGAPTSEDGFFADFFTEEDKPRRRRGLKRWSRKNPKPADQEAEPTLLPPATPALTSFIAPADPAVGKPSLPRRVRPEVSAISMAQPTRAEPSTPKPTDHDAPNARPAGNPQLGPLSRLLAQGKASAAVEPVDPDPTEPASDGSEAWLWSKNDDPAETTGPGDPDPAERSALNGEQPPERPPAETAANDEPFGVDAVEPSERPDVVGVLDSFVSGVDGGALVERSASSGLDVEPSGVDVVEPSERPDAADAPDSFTSGANDEPYPEQSEPSDEDDSAADDASTVGEPELKPYATPMTAVHMIPRRPAVPSTSADTSEHSSDTEPSSPADVSVSFDATPGTPDDRGVTSQDATVDADEMTAFADGASNIGEMSYADDAPPVVTAVGGGDRSADATMVGPAGTYGDSEDVPADVTVVDAAVTGEESDDAASSGASMTLTAFNIPIQVRAADEEPADGTPVDSPEAESVRSVSGSSATNDGTAADVVVAPLPPAPDATVADSSTNAFAAEPPEPDREPSIDEAYVPPPASTNPEYTATATSTFAAPSVRDVESPVRDPEHAAASTGSFAPPSVPLAPSGAPMGTYPEPGTYMNTPAAYLPPFVPPGADDGPPVSPPTTTLATRDRRIVVAAIGGVLVLAAAIGGAVLYDQNVHNAPAPCADGAKKSCVPPPKSAPSLVNVGPKFKYRTVDREVGYFEATVMVANGTSAPMDRWTLSFSYPGADVHNAWEVTLRQTGQNVIVDSKLGARPIRPGGTFEVRFGGSGSPSVPTDCRFNGQPCVFTR